MPKKRKWIFILLIAAAVCAAAVFWKKKPSENITVKFDTFGGTQVESQVIPRGTAAARPEDPEKEGFAFNKWMIGDVEYDFETALNDDAILRAMWLEVVPEPSPEAEKQDEQAQQQESSGSQEQPAPSPEPAPEPQPPADQGVVLNLSTLLSMRGEVTNFMYNHPDFGSQARKVLKKGIVDGMTIGLVVTYPDGSEISTGSTVSGDGASALSSLYFPNARQIIDKGFVPGMYLGMGAIYPDGTEIYMGAVLTEADRGFFEAIASVY